MIGFELYGDKNNENRKHHILWSGGMDSTLILYETLRYYDPSQVRAYSFIYPWLDTKKAERERKYRNSFKMFMDIKGIRFDHVEMGLNFSDLSTVVNIKGLGNVQFYTWMTQVLPFLDDGDAIYTGHLQDDTSPTALEAMGNLMDYAAKILARDMSYRTPLLHFHKTDVIWACMQAEIYNTAWFCECPTTDDPCMMCEPCRTHMAALYVLATFHGDPLTKAQAQKYLNKYTKIHEEVKEEEERSKGTIELTLDENE
jgi:7-cyano-7-deazaguanine synthase in queuosine biosynthesis